MGAAVAPGCCCCCCTVKRDRTWVTVLRATCRAGLASGDGELVGDRARGELGEPPPPALVFGEPVWG